jgi:hypothetical protein
MPRRLFCFWHDRKSKKAEGKIKEGLLFWNFSCVETRSLPAIDLRRSRSNTTRTPRIVRIIPSICSIGIGDLGFFGIGKKDYFENLRREKVLLESSQVEL